MVLDRTIKVAYLNLFTNKRLSWELTKVHGISIVVAQRLLLKLNWPVDIAVSQLTQSQIIELSKILEAQKLDALMGNTIFIHNAKNTN